MKKPLWTQKLSDEKLLKMLNYAQDIEACGNTNSTEVWNIVDTWYTNNVGIERLTLFCIDVYKEAAFRWMYSR